MFLSDLTQRQKETLMCLAHNVVVSDGELVTGESLMMQAMRREMGIDDDFEPHYLRLDGTAEIFDSRSARIASLLALIRLSYADGAYEIEEQCLLNDLATLFEVTPEEMARLDNWVKRLRALEREAQDLL